jgi:dienelactone hydrolase
MLRTVAVVAILSAASYATSCNSGSTPDEQQQPGVTQKASLKEEDAGFAIDTVTSKSYVVYDESIKGKRPAVLIIPEWWGLGDYVHGRAKQLAEMGYVAMAVDMYGSGKTADNPTDAQTFATPFYQNAQLTKMYIDAALNKLKQYEQADPTNVAAIGYCFGGFVVLNAAKQGADLKGVVSFHGGLAGVPPNKELMKAKVLVCHGAADNFVPDAEVNAFKKGMDSIGADYTFKVYPNATHAFTNPGATAVAKKFGMPIEYNASADSASWNDMKVFFGKIFPGK